MILYIATVLVSIIGIGAFIRTLKELKE